MSAYFELTALFKEAGIDPNYYLVVDSSSDLPYDFYRPGEEEERLPIHLLTQNGQIKELSRQSAIVESISGKRRTDISSTIRWASFATIQKTLKQN